MRHRIFGRQFSVDSDHRRAMLRNLAAGLFEHGEIETTLPKAKAVQPFVERLITIAKRRRGLAGRRLLTAKINDRRVHAWVADPNTKEAQKSNPYFPLPAESEIEFNRYGELRKAPRLIQHIIANVAPLFEERAGGYTRIVRTGRHRLGDGSDLVVLQLVGREEGPTVGGRRSTRRRTADRRTKFAAALRKSRDESGRSGAAAAAAPSADDAANG